jgi:hypothetical protein
MAAAAETQILLPPESPLPPVVVASPPPNFAALVRKEDVEPLLSTLGSGVDVRPSTIPNAGNGLFATRVFAQDEPITGYSGQLVRWTAVRKRPSSEVTHVRSVIAMTWAVDGLYAENGTRITDVHEQRRGRGVAAFANDSRGANVNAVFDFADSKKNSDPFALDPQERIVFLRATRAIAADEEIFVSYGQDYWKRVTPR